MIYLLLSILFNAVLFVIIKLFARFNIDALQALVVNYFVAFLVGLFFLENDLAPKEIINHDWFKGSILLGFVFISTFYATTLTSQRNGLSVASVASKMSVIIPITLGVILYNESQGFVKIIGILLALIAVYFTSKKETGKVEAKRFLFPILLFFGAGIVDTTMNYLQHTHLKDHEIALFSATTFLSAFFFGILISIYKTIKGTFKFEGKNILGGIALGITNYFSMYYLIKALHSKNLESATVFTLVNIGVILLSTLFGITLFKEKLLKQNYLGVLLAIIAVILVTL